MDKADLAFDENAPDPCLPRDGSSNTTEPVPTASSSAATPTATSWPDSAYPETPDVFQPGLYPDGGVFLTGYFLKNISTAVLSIPSFEMYGNDIQTFSDTVARFQQASYAAGMQKILIDLQGNSGGDSLLAVDTFKHFFPSNDTFRGSRLRAHYQADILGNTFTNTFNYNTSINGSDHDALSAWPWVATDRLNAETGQNFTSWSEFFGPVQINGDAFTKVQRDNISSSIFDRQALGIDIVGAAVPPPSPQLYEPEDIILLSDDLCSSACSLFVEMMHYEAGVRAVVVGGSPQSGSIQIAGASRGVQLYLSDNIDLDIQLASYFNSTTSNQLPDRVTDYFYLFIGINLRDQVRKEQDDIPLQFIYDAADCRIFYTPQTWNYYTSLWTYAVNAINNPKLCVNGSTGFATTSKNSLTATPPPAPKTAAPNASATLDTDADIFSGRQLGTALLKFADPKSGRLPRVPSQPCANSPGQGCPTGRCQCTPTGQKSDAFPSPKPGCSGTCPYQRTSTDAVSRLRPDGDNPGEINGDGSRKKGNRHGTVAEAIPEIWAGRGGGDRRK